MFGETFNNLNLSFRERARGGFVDLEREWRDFLRGLIEGVWGSLSARHLAKWARFRPLGFRLTKSVETS
jgi:hypothetical protein